ncbi:DUF4157 domain-containing protein [Mucilaginibacter sp. BJC16-A38]|uniref:eCIS core domain-containing protein n=1 Tax=Mucilaginibacter phenanthrenivorans TaxID=1234842 RepID=UPI002157C857|nr:DUF4157 domain-containing protein [Mucilaginibacter phenanthrenivorans]MCR8557640.1 DUF4157 domain-containing protein [Mucilaginibacter phenanthrenivorans]
MGSVDFKHNDDKKQANNPANGTPFFKPVIQPKLTVNEPGDSFEQEADTMADRVMNMSHPGTGQSAFFNAANAPLQRKCQACEEEDKFVHRKESDGSDVQGGHDLDNYVGSLGSTGQSMPQSSRQFFEPRFGHDFSNVKIHTDSVAAKSAQSINALAYTTGNNIIFNSGQYSPESDSGKKLMAHELTHVVQQSDRVQPYRPKNAFNFGKADQPPALVEDSFNWDKDQETKPWIEEITVTLDKQQTDANGANMWTGTGVAKYYKDKMTAVNFTVAAGSPELGMTTAGNFHVIRMEGVGYNSGSHSAPFKPGEREGPNNRYSKDLSANMHFAVFFHGGEALHQGPTDASSHGCVHVGGEIQQINYHSVLYHTKVNIIKK